MDIESNYKKQRGIISACFMVSMMAFYYLFKTYNYLLPKSVHTIVLITFLFLAIFIFTYFIYKVSPKEKRFAVLVMPITLIILGIVTFVIEILGK